MKILMINSVCGIRSTGRICTDLAESLEALGHECKIAYGRERVPEKHQKYAIRIGTDLSVKLHGIKARLFDAAGFGSAHATRKFIKWVKKYDPDVIHLHNLHGYYINLPLLFNYLKTSGKPVLWTLHDCWAFTGHCCNLTDCDKWRKECFACPKYASYPKSVIDRSRHNFKEKKKLFSSLEHTTLVTPSAWLADLTKKSYLGKYPVKVINNGIDTSVFKPTQSDFREKHGLEGKKIVLGVASAWSKNKGLYDFVKLSDMLDDTHKIVLVGLTEEQKSTLPAKILGITRTNSPLELAEIYTAADVFVNLTYNDNYPTVNLEAQACGTPVITYRTGGSVESVETANIIPQGDLATLLKLLDVPLAIKQQNFSKALCAQKYLEIILKCKQKGES